MMFPLCAATARTVRPDSSTLGNRHRVSLRKAYAKDGVSPVQLLFWGLLERGSFDAFAPLLACLIGGIKGPVKERIGVHPRD